MRTQQARRSTLLIDADILAYQAAAANETTFRFPNGIVGADVRPLELATKWADQWLRDIRKEYGGNPEVLLCWSCADKDYFRKDFFPAYKENRKGARAPEQRGDVREYLERTWPSKVKPRLEGDDVLGIMATALPRMVMVSIDKDLKTVPGIVFNPDKGKKVVTEAEADWWFLMQTLTGDPTDGYPGAKGIGPKKAEKLLQAPNGERLCLWSAWQAVICGFGGDEEVALTQARCARILRASDWDFEKGEVVPWTPPK